MTPCEKIGLKVGDEVKLLSQGAIHTKLNIGEIFILDEDDGTNFPFFRIKNRKEHTTKRRYCLKIPNGGQVCEWVEMTKTESEKRGAKFGTMGVVKDSGEKCVYIGVSPVLSGVWEICVEGRLNTWSVEPNSIRLDHEPEFKEIKFCDATHEQRMVAENVHDDMGSQAKEVFYSDFQKVYIYVVNRGVLTTATTNNSTFHVKVPN